jgi:hypothetical protein
MPKEVLANRPENHLDTTIEKIAIITNDRTNA